MLNLQVCVVFFYSSNDCHECSSIDVIQYIDKSPISIEGLQHESAEIERKFAKVASSILQSLIARNVSKDSLVACLMGFNCLTKVFDGSKQCMFRKQRERFDDPSATVATVWKFLGDYFSFFDYDILEMITDTLGTVQDKDNIAAYKNDFEGYARQRLFIHKLSSESDQHSNKESTSMFVMLDPSFDDCEVGHLKTLQTKLSTIFCLKKGVLRLCKVKKGSILLIFEIPDFIPCIIFPLSPDQESALRELGVTQLDCGDYHFRAKVCTCEILWWSILY